MIIYYFSQDGKKIAEKIKNIKVNAVLKSSKDFKISEEISKDFSLSDSIIFISSVGIAIRMIAKYINSKETDPAVLVIDDMGKFTIPILSGHLGGANELAMEISGILNNTPVITTATDSRGIEAADSFARRMGYAIDDLEMNKVVMSMIIDGKKVDCYSENANYPKGPYIISTELNDKSDAMVYISSEKREFKIPTVWLIPKNINIGIGARRGVSFSDLWEVLNDALNMVNLDIRGIKSISSIDIKADEQAIIELSEKLSVPFKTYSQDEILSVENIQTKSDFVMKTLGVPAVSEPSAILSGGELLLSKHKDKGITISITKEIK